MAKGKVKDIESIISQLADVVKQKVKGLEQVYRGQESEILGVKKFLTTEIWAIDWMLGGKGLPYTRVVELYGDFSSGKTWFVYLMLGKAQKDGSVAVLIETEGAYDPATARLAGVDTDKLLVIAPDSVESVFNAINTIFTEHDTDIPVVIAWDSIAATSTNHELEEGMDVRDMSKAFKMSQGLRLITKKIGDSGGMFIAANQVRSKIGVMYGEKETTSGGRGMEFHSSVRLKFSKIGKLLDENKDVTGQRLKIECTKSKICVPFRNVEIELIHGQSVPAWEGMLPLLKKKGFIVDNRGWNTFVGDDAKWRDSQFSEMIITDIGKRIVSQFLGVGVLQ